MPKHTDNHSYLMFEMYTEPKTTYGDIVRYFSEHGIKDFSRAAPINIMCNPIYVGADLDICEFFKSQSAFIVNNADDFTGVNGCYSY